MGFQFPSCHGSHETSNFKVTLRVCVWVHFFPGFPSHHPFRGGYIPGGIFECPCLCQALLLRQTPTPMFLPFLSMFMSLDVEITRQKWDYYLQQDQGAKEAWKDFREIRNTSHWVPQTKYRHFPGHKKRRH